MTIGYASIDELLQELVEAGTDASSLARSNEVVKKAEEIRYGLPEGVDRDDLSEALADAKSRIQNRYYSDIGNDDPPT